MTCAPFVIYVDLKSILLPFDKRKGFTYLYQNNKIWAASALHCSTVPTFDKQFHLFTSENSVNQLLDQPIRWKTDIVEHFKINCRMMPLSRQQQTAHDNAVVCCTVMKRECLAVVWDITDQFHCYLYGSKFTVRTDNQLLKWLQSLSTPSGCIAR